MTNYEYYKEALVKIWLEGENTAVDKNGFVAVCGPSYDPLRSKIRCKNCVFNVRGKSCAYAREQWYKQEHTVELKVDLSNISEYAKSRDLDLQLKAMNKTTVIATATVSDGVANHNVVIEIADKSPNMILRVHKLFTPYYIELGIINRYVTAEDITKAIDAFLQIFPEKEDKI